MNKKKSSTMSELSEKNTTNWFALFRESGFIIITAISLFLIVALLTYRQADFSASDWHFAKQVHNAGGHIGALFASVFLRSFGILAFIFPLLIIYSAWLTFYVDQNDSQLSRTVLIRNVGIMITLIAGCALSSFLFKSGLPVTAGGLLGSILSDWLAVILGLTGSLILLTASLLAGITFLSGLSWWRFTQKLFKLSSIIFQKTYISSKNMFLNITIKLISMIPRPTFQFKRAKQSTLKIEPVFDGSYQKDFSKKLKETSRPVSEKPKIKVSKPPAPKQILKKVKSTDDMNSPLPAIDLLDPPSLDLKMGFSPDVLQSMSEAVEQRLLDFGVQVKVVAVHPGPVITRFELDLAPGVKVSKISGLAKDLARSLSVVSVRIVEVIPGKSVIGVELPNEHREMIRLSEVLVSAEYQRSKEKLPLVLGKDIAGVATIVDLAKMPHLLVAGTTGSGKSVGLNAMLLSLLFRHVPEDLRLIMIDPKMLELAIYDDIPHLLTPVVTDMKEAANALRWCVVEMERRYRLMAACGVRNLAGFNQKVKEALERGEPLLDPLQPEDLPNRQTLTALPHIVVVIDEFADMMMVVGKKVEQLIARIAQKARAAGIHMILATQRPSVDVITGLIKSNIPTRISFQVSSKIDSRTIIDQQGAEQLLGHGDMLYLAPGLGTPDRVHGAFVADHEVHAVTTAWKQRGKPDYLDLAMNDMNADSTELEMMGLESESQSEQDPLYDQVIYFVTKSRKVSVSSVQRRFKIGYNRAARLVDSMESAGVVSAMEQNGSREVLAPPPVES